LSKKPDSRPRPFIISDDTTTIPPETDQAFPMHMNQFVMDRVDDDLEEELEQIDAYDSKQRDMALRCALLKYGGYQAMSGCTIGPKHIPLKASAVLPPISSLPAGKPYRVRFESKSNAEFAIHRLVFVLPVRSSLCLIPRLQSSSSLSQRAQSKAHHICSVT